MPRSRSARPRSPSERSRAGRLRSKLAAGTLGKGEGRELARYDRAVTVYRDARAKLPPTPRAGGRPRTNTERGRAAKLRAKGRAGELNKAEQRSLDSYDATVTAAKRKRGLRRARLRTRHPAEDAADIAASLAAWLGGVGAVQGTEAGSRSEGASAEATIKPQAREIPKDGGPDLTADLSKGHAVSIRALLRLGDGGAKWSTILAYTTDAEVAGVDVWAALSEAFDGYKATSVEAIAAIVGPA